MCDTSGMTRKPEIPPDLAAEMTPAVRQIVDALLERLAQLEDRLQQSPQNSPRLNRSSPNINGTAGPANVAAPRPARSCRPVCRIINRGPRLVEFVALLMSDFRQSKRRVSVFCESVLNTPMSPGLVVNLQNLATSRCVRSTINSLPRFRRSLR